MTEIYAEISKLSSFFRKMCYGITKDEEVINDALQSKDERYPNFDATQHMIMSQSFGKSSGMPSGEFDLRNYQVEDEEEKLMNRHNYMLEFFRTQKTLTDIMT